MIKQRLCAPRIVSFGDALRKLVGLFKVALDFGWAQCIGGKVRAKTSRLQGGHDELRTKPRVVGRVDGPNVHEQRARRIERRTQSTLVGQKRVHSALLVGAHGQSIKKPAARKLLIRSTVHTFGARVDAERNEIGLGLVPKEHLGRRAPPAPAQ